ncbi:MAG: hypothetical protein IJ713_07435 [Oscillibacter sp.]|nr:hypothetical protein [Oscillibacter sp.]
MIHIGIDTGRHTGFAVWDGTRFVELDTKSISAAILETLRYAANFGRENVTVYIEDARLRTWIPREKSLAEFKGRAQGAGSVKRDASIWEDFCAEEEIRLVKVPPKYNTTKLSSEAFARITGYKGRTSEHARDAAMLVFGK